ncbi:MAG: hypothetical protein WBG73_17345 [Coleofasciculaceae cyanobacterium]
MTYIYSREFFMAINLFGDLSQNWQKVTTFSSEAVNQVTETSQKAKDALTNSANTAVNALSKSTNRAVDILNQTTDKAKAVLSETTNQAVNTITTNTEQAKASLEASIKKAESVSGKASDVLQNAISSLINDWINAHPNLLWLVSHPLISLALLFLAILIISGLLKALGQFFEKGWLVILQAPFRFSLFIFGSIYQFIKGLFVRKNLVIESIKPANLKPLSSQSLVHKKRLAEIFSRLDALNQEQKQLMQEAASLLKSDEVSVS